MTEFETQQKILAELGVATLVTKIPDGEHYVYVVEVPSETTEDVRHSIRMMVYYFCDALACYTNNRMMSGKDSLADCLLSTNSLASALVVIGRILGEPVMNHMDKLAKEYAKRERPW